MAAFLAVLVSCRSGGEPSTDAASQSSASQTEPVAGPTLNDAKGLGACRRELLEEEDPELDRRQADFESRFVERDGRLHQMSDWWFCGPFEATDGETAFHTSFPPERVVDLEEAYDGGQQWLRRPAWNDERPHNLPGFHSACYLYRTVEADCDQMVRLHIGSDDAVRAWLNDERIVDNLVQRRIGTAQERVEVPLRRGANTILLKIVNFEGFCAFAFSVHLRAEDDALRRRLLDIARRPRESRTTEESLLWRTFYRERFSPAVQEIDARLRKLWCGQ